MSSAYEHTVCLNQFWIKPVFVNLLVKRKSFLNLWSNTVYLQVPISSRLFFFENLYEKKSYQKFERIKKKKKSVSKWGNVKDSSKGFPIKKLFRNNFLRSRLFDKEARHFAQNHVYL